VPLLFRVGTRDIIVTAFAVAMTDVGVGVYQCCWLVLRLSRNIDTGSMMKGDARRGYERMSQYEEKELRASGSN
jgi:hypothetical protein